MTKHNEWKMLYQDLTLFLGSHERRNSYDAAGMTK